MGAEIVMLCRYDFQAAHKTQLVSAHFDQAACDDALDLSETLVTEVSLQAHD